MALQRLREAAEKAKIELSASVQVIYLHFDSISLSTDNKKVNVIQINCT